ncbi:unnamed protein product [Thelazia callipaeda]|uniref:Uncharacterized protein n=1 Tax=Thelazia callipaeda TaxID=103827 RepID=A0A0N5CZP6_THECL|nr:unnamed protein product [Thelazia callipaeda]
MLDCHSYIKVLSGKVAINAAPVDVNLPRVTKLFSWIPVMQRMRYFLPTPEEAGHQLPAAIPVQPAAHHVFSTPEVVGESVAVAPGHGALIAQQSYPAVETGTGYQVAVAEPASPPMALSLPVGGTLTGTFKSDTTYSAANHDSTPIYGGKQYSNEVIKRRVIKMAVAPSNATEPEENIYGSRRSESMETEESGDERGSSQPANQSKNAGYMQRDEPESEVPFEALGLEQGSSYSMQLDTSRSGHRLRRVILHE